MVSVVLVDNGEPTLKQCVDSIRNQSVRVDEIILVSGPKTDKSLAWELADYVIGPYEYIGYGRFVGIQRAGNNIVMLADSDTIYDRDYVKHALESIQKSVIVKAGSVHPLDTKDPLWVFDYIMFRITGAYEFGWVINRDKLLNYFTTTDINKLMNPRTDLGHIVSLKPIKSSVNYKMVCWTRLPTYFTKNYLIPTVGTVAVSSIIPALVVKSALKV